MKTPEYYLDEVAKENRFKDWDAVMYHVINHNYSLSETKLIVKEAMLRHSKEACEEQKHNSLEGFKKCFAERGSKEELEQSIINAKSPIE